MSTLILRQLLLSGTVLCSVSAFSQRVPCQDSSAVPATDRWYVYRDVCSVENHGEWTNWMPTESGDMITLDLTSNEAPFYGSTHVAVSLSFSEPYWAGIAVASFPDYWGEQEADDAFDLSDFNVLVFHARGRQGGEKIRVQVAIAGDKPYGDSALTAPGTGWLELAADWGRYELRLDGYDLRRVITPFVFVSSRDANTRGQIEFDLDEIFFTRVSP